MKRTIIVIMLFLASNSFARKIHVKNAGGTGDGLTDGAAWSPAKFIATTPSLQPGDTIMFNKGEVFNITFEGAYNAGTELNPIVYTSYGTGAKPIFNGLTTFSSYTPHPTIPNVYSVDLDVPYLQVVLIDGVLTGMGRYPKTGFLPFTGNNGIADNPNTPENEFFVGSYISGPDVASVPFDPTGGQLVVRKYRYITDRHPIISRSGDAINFTSPGLESELGETNSNALSNGNGYFIQNHIGTLTQNGDWYYDNVAKKFYVYFTGSPTSHTVQAASARILVSANARSYMTFDGLAFRGANYAAINEQYADHLKITNCDFSYCTVGVLALQGAGYNSVTYSTFNDMLDASISTWETNFYTVDHNYVRNVSLIQGLGRSGDLKGSGMTLTGDDILVSNNTVINSGYNGIAWYSGNGVVVENNFVDTTGLTKDDGGGIYTYGGFHQTFRTRTVRNNIVLHGIGNVEGCAFFATEGLGVGIYLDNYSSDVRIENNYIAHNTGAGVFFNSTRRDTMVNNVIFDNHKWAFWNPTAPGHPSDNLYILNNQLIAAGNEALIDFEMYDTKTSINSKGLIAGNYLYRPFGDANYIVVDDRTSGSPVVQNYNISGFQTEFTHNTGTNITIPINSVNDFKEVYNTSSGISNTPLPGVYKTVTNSEIATGNVDLAPYSGSVLIYNRALEVIGGSDLPLIIKRIRIRVGN